MPYKIFAALFLFLAGCGGSSEPTAVSSDPPSDPPPAVEDPEPPLGLGHPSEGRSYRIAFVGNSITQHGPRPDSGWHGNWGMAATAQEFDYVHQFLEAFHEYGAETEYLLGDARGFEADYLGYDVSEMSQLRDFNADVIIIRLGENAQDVADDDSFSQHLIELVEFIDGESPSAVVITDTFIPHPKASAQIEVAADAGGYTFCRISDLINSPANTAVGQYADPGIERHPSDQGMYEISKRLYDCLEESGYFSTTL